MYIKSGIKVCKVKYSFNGRKFIYRMNLEYKKKKNPYQFLNVQLKLMNIWMPILVWVRPFYTWAWSLNGVSLKFQRWHPYFSRFQTRTAVIRRFTYSLIYGVNTLVRNIRIIRHINIMLNVYCKLCFYVDTESNKSIHLILFSKIYIRLFYFFGFYTWLECLTSMMTYIEWFLFRLMFAFYNSLI